MNVFRRVKLPVPLRRLDSFLAARGYARTVRWGSGFGDVVVFRDGPVLAVAYGSDRSEWFVSLGSASTVSFDATTWLGVLDGRRDRAPDLSLDEPVDRLVAEWDAVAGLPERLPDLAERLAALNAATPYLPGRGGGT